MDLAPSIPFTADLDAELLAAYPGLVRRLALVMRNAVEAEDVAQAAYMRALERRHTFGGGDARAWFYTIGLRLAFNELRRRRRQPPLTAEEPSWAVESDPDLWAALSQVDPQHRAALLLNVLDGYTHAEIGQMLGVRTGTVSSWLSRTRQQLRVTLGAEQ
jgi:RNA polymerase sigma-70 factor (ECF subfamily)